MRPKVEILLAALRLFLLVSAVMGAATDQKVRGSNLFGRAGCNHCSPTSLGASAAERFVGIPLSIPQTGPVGTRRLRLADEVSVWLASGMRSYRGAGSLRERRPGVWEVRVAPRPAPVSGGSQRRSLTVHGDQEVAVTARHRCAEQAWLARARRSYRPSLSLADLLATWLATDHRWRPSTLSGYRSVVKFLTGDPLAGRRAVQVSAVALRAACASWRQEGGPNPRSRAGPLPALGTALGLCRADRGL